MSGREYPIRPIVGLLAVVQRGDRFLLVRRAKPPNQGHWGFPGGVQELGETVFDGVLRELAEETGIVAAAPTLLTTLDVIDRDAEGKVRYHYTLIALHLIWREGEGVAADDADALGWFAPEEVAGLEALPGVAPIMRQALARSAAAAVLPA